jgi:hypothetical protein
MKNALSYEADELQETSRNLQPLLAVKSKQQNSLSNNTPWCPMTPSMTGASQAILEERRFDRKYPIEKAGGKYPALWNLLHQHQLSKQHHFQNRHLLMRAKNKATK